MNKQNDFSGRQIFPPGEPADAVHFIGQAWAETLVRADDPLNCPTWNVTFAPAHVTTGTSTRMGRFCWLPAGAEPTKQKANRPAKSKPGMW